MVSTRSVLREQCIAALGVNIDHVATVREARKTNEPDPFGPLRLAELGGADDYCPSPRRPPAHSRAATSVCWSKWLPCHIDLELACADDVLTIACEHARFTLVPERREEVTTEGGLDVVGGRKPKLSVDSRTQALS